MENDKIKEEFIQKVKDLILVKDEEYKNLQFNLSLDESGYKLDDIFDPKIKEKIRKLFEKDRVLRAKHDEKMLKKFEKDRDKYLKKLSKNKQL